MFEFKDPVDPAADLLRRKGLGSNDTPSYLPRDSMVINVEYGMPQCSQSEESGTAVDIVSAGSTDNRLSVSGFLLGEGGGGGLSLIVKWLRDRA